MPRKLRRNRSSPIATDSPESPPTTTRRSTPRRSQRSTKAKVNYSENLSESEYETPLEEVASEEEYSFSSDREQSSVGEEQQSSAEDEENDTSTEKRALTAEEKLLESGFSFNIKNILGRRDSEEGSEFFILWRGLAYIHASWLSEDSISKHPDFKRCLKRYSKKLETFDAELHDLPEGHYFNPNYVIPERILNEETRTEEGETINDYLVKWTDLEHEFATWEMRETIEGFDALYEEYRRLRSVKKKVFTSEQLAVLRNRGFNPFEESPEFPDPSLELRSYQLEGMNWIVFSWTQSRNVILADEMGLGKTIQAITLMWFLSEYRSVPGPFLVVAPLSTLEQWKREVSKWTSLHPLIYNGSIKSKEVIRDTEWNLPARKRTSASKKSSHPGFIFDVLITSYELVVREPSTFRNIPWVSVICDEAHRVKDTNSKAFQSLFSLDTDHKLLLTGTPLQNNINELWALLYFIDPEKFGDFDEFSASYGELKEAEQVKRLHGELKPYLLRRMKSDVETSIVPKEETIIEVELTKIQKKYYKAIYEENADILIGKRDRMSLMNVAMQLRKCCIHPYTIDGIEENETSADADHETTLNKMIYASGKLLLLDKLLPKLQKDGHKVLIFSQFKLVLNILEDFLVYRDYSYERLDGDITGLRRQKAIDRFCDPDSDRFVFILSTKAGGVGINLTAADTVVIFDSDWNPQNDIQAQARCHRIGQTQKVKIYRLITRNTYESEMFERASKKLGLDRAVLSSMAKGALANTQKVKEPTKKEIEGWLKFGAYHSFTEDKENSNPTFYEDDIEDILKNSSHTVQYDQETGESLFSKASFVSKKEDMEVSIDDPNFWGKMGIKAPEKKVDTRYLNRAARKSRMRGKYTEFGDYIDGDEFDPSDESADENSEDEDVVETEVFARHFTVWSYAQRQRFLQLLRLYGYGPWQRFSGDPALAGKSIMQLKEYALALIIQYDNRCSTKSVQGKLLRLLFPELVAVGNVVFDSGVKQNRLAATQWHRILDTIRIDASLTTEMFLSHLSDDANAFLQHQMRLFCMNVWAIECGNSIQQKTQLESLIKSSRSNASCLPDELWDIHMDFSLLVGISKYGYGEFQKIRNDVTLGFDRVYGEHGKPWPSSKTLDKRARFILQLLAKSVGKSKKTLTIIANEEKQALLEQYKLNAVSCEKFGRALVRFPFDAETAAEDDWEFFRSLAESSHLSVSAFKLVYRMYLREVRLVVENAAKRKETVETFEESSDESDGSEVFEVENVCCEVYVLINVQIGDKKPVTVIDRVRPLEGLVNEKLARRILELAPLFKSLFKLFRAPNFDGLLALALPVRHVNMPSWWIARVFDKELLQAVLFLGYGEWTKIKDDPKFNLFDNVDAGDLAALGPLLENHIRYLCRVLETKLNEEFTNRFLPPFVRAPPNPLLHVRKIGGNGFTPMNSTSESRPRQAPASNHRTVKDIALEKLAKQIPRLERRSDSVSPTAGTQQAPVDPAPAKSYNPVQYGQVLCPPQDNVVDLTEEPAVTPKKRSLSPSTEESARLQKAQAEGDGSSEKPVLKAEKPNTNM